MDWAELLNQICQTLIIPLLGIFVTAAVKAINVKKQQYLEESNSDLQKKYIEMLSNIITDCVAATNQTYVSELKKQDAFTKEAQKQALKKTSENVYKILSEEARKTLEEAYGDLSNYILAKIESEISNNKPKGY